jgi:hypothetical protein
LAWDSFHQLPSSKKKMEDWILDTKDEETSIYKPYYQSYATPFRDHSSFFLTHYAYFVTYKEFICMVPTS